MVNLEIDNKSISVVEGTSILEAAKSVGIDIPTLCFLKEINEVGSCRMCIVEIEGKKGFVSSCIQKCEEGMKVKTKTQELENSRKTILNLILSNHDKNCAECVRSENCELKYLAEKYGIEQSCFEGEKNKYELDNKSLSIEKNLNKCILCGRCVSICKKNQGIGAIDMINRGFSSCVSTVENKSLNDVNCVNCGQCINVCPTGALKEKDDIGDVEKELKNKEKFVIVQVAPAVRVALGEEFRMPIGTNVVGKIVTALKQLGFDNVFDTSLGADLTIVEEATEFIERLEENRNFPMITSCSPGWIKYIEMNFPEQLENLSTCKSPHQMFGAILKSYYASKIGIEPEKICVVSIMPCVAKKFECKRREMQVNEIYDVDYVLTTRELARMIKKSNINFSELKDSEFESSMGEVTGAGVIFGNTGGVMEAALRTVSEMITGDSMQNLTIKQARGEKGIKEIVLKLNGRIINAAVVQGLVNAKKIMEEVKNKRSKYDFIEIMACKGGCIMGGGQPIHTAKEISELNIKELRAKGLYQIDVDSKIRESHKNPVIKNLYKEYLEKPGSNKAHELLHTKYQKREKYNY